MKILDLRPTHKAITTYYTELHQLAQVEADREGAVSPAFANLLRHCAKQFNWTLYEQYPLKAGNKNIYPDGALVDVFKAFSLYKCSSISTFFDSAYSCGKSVMLDFYNS
jgi:hypothetical protein